MRQFLSRLALFLLLLLVVFGVYRLLTIQPLPEREFFARSEGQLPLWVFDFRHSTDQASPLEAMTAANQQGAGGLLLPVYLTRDGELVIVNEQGNGDQVSQLSLAELRAGQAGHGYQVVTLQEVLASLPDTRLLIQVQEPSLPALAALLQVAEASDNRGRLLAIVDDQQLAEILRQQVPDLATAYTSQEIGAFMPTYRLGLVPFYRPAASGMLVPGDVITEALVKAAHSRGVHVIAVAEDATPVELQDWLDKGVDGIVVRDPDLLSARQERSQSRLKLVVTAVVRGLPHVC